MTGFATPSSRGALEQSDEQSALNSILRGRKITFANQEADQMSVRSSTSGSFKVPVFVFPNELTFIANDPSSHKQVVTIYNPYDFHIQYKALCTAPDKYFMPDWKGSLPPGRRIDIVIRMKEVDNLSIGAMDKFRFQIFDLSSPTLVLVGEREVSAVLVASEDSVKEISSKDSFRPKKSQSVKERENVERREEVEPPNVVAVLGALLCIAALCLPRTGEATDSWISTYITLSVNQQLFSAFVLGLITMALLKR